MSAQRRVFPDSFKREAVDRVANSGLTASAVARVGAPRDGAASMDDTVRGAGELTEDIRLIHAESSAC